MAPGLRLGVVHGSIMQCDRAEGIGTLGLLLANSARSGQRSSSTPGEGAMTGLLGPSWSARLLYFAAALASSYRLLTSSMPWAGVMMSYRRCGPASPLLASDLVTSLLRVGFGFKLFLRVPGSQISPIAPHRRRTTSGSATGTDDHWDATSASQYGGRSAGSHDGSGRKSVYRPSNGNRPASMSPMMRSPAARMRSASTAVQYAG